GAPPALPALPTRRSSDRLVFHTGVGNVGIRALKGPGSGMYNYTRQMNDAVDIITQLVAGGVLDRNPKAHILFAEHSAGWLWGLRSEEHTSELQSRENLVC